MDDPFSCFGDDDETDSDEELDTDANDALAESRRLVEDANARAQNDATRQNPNSEERSLPPDPGATTTVPTKPVASATKIYKMNPFPSRKPLYVSPSVATARTGVGGGRGVVALENLPAGTVVLVEEPSMKWPDVQLGNELGLVSVKEIVRRDGGGATGVIRDVETLHPTKEMVDRSLATTARERPDDNDDDEFRDLLQIETMMRDLRAVHDGGDEISDVVTLAKTMGVTNSDGSEFAFADALRVLLALRYNGFESGLYFHIAMFNHSCDPNCIKYSPCNDDGKYYSEVCTTRPVSAGEALTVHYLNPREVSHASRRRRLWDQHRFDIGAEPYRSGTSSGLANGGDASPRSRVEELYETDLVRGVVPPSPVDGVDANAPTFRVESALEDLEEALSELLRGGAGVETLRGAQELETAAGELCRVAEEELGNPRHVLLVRCRRLHAESCEVVLKVAARIEGAMTPEATEDVAVRCLRSSLILLGLREDLLGGDHPDVAASLLDCAESIASLLGSNPGKLAGIELEDGDVSGKSGSSSVILRWSKEEARLRSAWRRLKNMYPIDRVQNLINDSIGT